MSNIVETSKIVFKSAGRSGGGWYAHVVGALSLESGQSLVLETPEGLSDEDYTKKLAMSARNAAKKHNLPANTFRVQRLIEGGKVAITKRVITANGNGGTPAPIPAPKPATVTAAPKPTPAPKKK